MRSKEISESVREKVAEMVERFNEESIGDPNRHYSVRYRGNYLYLDRIEYGKAGPVCRLKFNGRMDNWDFAIYKYSTESYDPDEWFFPGSESVDGTVEGAMKAGLKAYP
ncbi:hypothetical protein ACFL6S_07855 [Candidatus Poribacteria bacterium]